jgi:tetratricopeptide (TPR) repeat protein
MSNGQDRLIEEALRTNLVTPEQVEEARGIQQTVSEIGISQSLTEILVKKGHLTEDQVRTLQRGLSQQKIGKYEIMDKLGEGGAGVVYRARHAMLGRVVALKVLSSRRASDPQYLERFVREARVAVTLNHRSIVRGLDYGEADGYHYFVMEFVPGDTLYEILQREGKVEEPRALEIGIQVAKALRHAQQFDLCHRDLKPDNIMISVETGETKVCDLGLAKPKHIETKGGSGKTGAIGTPSYIAPEQIRGTGEADTRSDIYSLGATLYHAVCGHPPFTGKSVEDLLRKHLNEPPRDPREVVVELSSGTAAVLLKMLEKDPNDRYQGLDELIADLEAVSAGRPPVHTIAFARKGPAVAEGRTRAELARQRSGSWKLLVPLLGVVAAVVVGVVVFGGKGEPGPEEPPAATSGTESTTLGPSRTGPREPTPQELATKALRAANTFWKANPERYASAVERYDFVVEKYGETRQAIDAREGRVAVLAAWNKRASDTWSELDEDVARALEQGRFGAALNSVDGFPEELRAAEGFGKLYSDRREEVLRLADEAWTEAAGEATRAAGKLEFERAMKLLEPFVACGLPDLEKAATEGLSKLRTEKDRVDEQKGNAATAFRRLYGGTILTQGEKGYDAAFGLLEEARESEVFRYVQDRLEQAAEDLNRIAAFEEAIRGGYEDRRGRTLVIRGTDGRSRQGRLENAGRDGLLLDRGGSMVRVSWSEIPVDSRCQVGLAKLGEMNADSRLAAGLWLLSRGRLDLVAKQLQAAASLGGAIAPYEDRVELVRSVREERIQEVLGQARVHQLEGRHEDARKALDRAAAAWPDHAGVRYRRGLLLVELRRFGPAIEDLEEALRLGEKDPGVHRAIGRALEQEGRFEEALRAYDLFLRNHPMAEDAEEVARRAGEIRGRLSAEQAKRLRSQGDASLRKRDWKSAFESFREADRLVPDDPRTVLGLAKSASKTQQVLLSYVTYQRYLALRPTGSGAREARQAVASMLVRYEKPDKAISDLHAGKQAYGAGKYDDAIERLDSALKIAPLNADGYYNRAWSWYSKALISGAGSHAEAARSDFDRLLLLKPTDDEALVGRALCWLELRKPERALADARRASEIRADNVNAYVAAHLALYTLERYGDSRDAIDRALRISPEDVSHHMKRAKASWAMREYGQALVDLDKAASCPGVTTRQTQEIRSMRVEIQKQREGG